MGLLFFAVRTIGPETMREWVVKAGVWAPVVLVMVKASTIVFAPLSGGFLYPLAGTLFGFGKGFGLVVLGDAIGGAISFWISRTFGRAAVERLLGKETRKLARVLDLIGTVRGFFVARVIFIMSQDLMSYAAGLTRLPVIPFFVIHVGVGLAPNALLTWSGSLLTGHESDMTLPGIITGIGLVSGLSALGFLWYTGKLLLETKPGDGSTPRAGAGG